MTISTVRRSDHGGVAVLALDYPDRTVNVIDERLLGDLDRELDAAWADADVDAIVLTSAKDSFGAGADVAWLPELAARPDAECFLADNHRLMTRLVRSEKPIVAALHGSAVGGALELALGATALIAAEGATLGLPEVSLEILPGGGGTQLVRRFVPDEAALDLLTTGRLVGADEARELGLIQAVVASEALMDESMTMAAALADGFQPAPLPRGGSVATINARRETLRAGRAGLGSAAATILDVVEVGIVEGLEAGLAAERRGFLDLLREPAARAAIHLFQAESAIKRRTREPDGVDSSRLAVLGGGQMGAGIAATAVRRGLSVVVRDVKQESLDRARAHLARVMDRMGGDRAATDRWSGTTGWDGFAEADTVVEAIYELPELKREVLSALSAQVSTDTLVATNTSAISIATLAESVRRPERFLGMHFFSPVERMPLVELIPHEGTSLETATRAAAVGRRLGKTPITVGDAPGFYTSRVYARWLIEGVRLLLDGVAPAEVDAAARAVGFPVGPLQAHDEATLELVLQASVGQVADSVMTERVDVPAVRRALETLVDAGLRGRRHGLGFYTYDAGKRTGANEHVLDILGIAPAPVDGNQARGRLLLAFVSECLLCWDDGTLCHPSDGDVGAVLGLGFPRRLGGPFQWADEVSAPELVQRFRTLGEREFPAGDTLFELAREGGTFAALPRRPRPFATPGPCDD